MQRVKFKVGQQRKFLNLVINKLNCVSLRGILQYGFNIKYSSLKNYYVERRHFSDEFFEDLCHLAKIDPGTLDVKHINENYGQIKGGKKSKRKI